MSNAPLLLVLSGPSAVGKDSILNRLREMGYPVHFTVTATTRPRRLGEVDGRDYYFLTAEQFARLRDEDGLLEHACVYGQWYGVPKRPVLEAIAAGQDVIMRTNVDGATSIRSRAPGAVLIFVTAPSFEDLERRLRGRQTDSMDDIATRLAKVREELAMIDNFDYVVVNSEGELDQCVSTIDAIVRAERCRVARPSLGLV